jgi:hypothetical protein
MKKSLVMLAIAGFSAPVFAQVPDFSAIDADSSGGVTLEELRAVIPDVTSEQFQAADGDNSSDLSEEEFQALSS